MLIDLGLASEQGYEDPCTDDRRKRAGHHKEARVDDIRHVRQPTRMTWAEPDRGDARQRLLIKVTAGSDAPERCSQAFTVAGTAAASGIPISLWLTGEAAWFALPGRAAEFSLPHAASLAELLESVLQWGQVTLCTQCAQRRAIDPADLLPGIRMGGAAAFIDEATAPGTQALVY